MKGLFMIAVMALIGGCQHDEMIQNLPLQWASAEMRIRPSPLVADAFAHVTLGVAVRDVRPDPTAVGRYDDGFVVRTTDNVGQYTASKIAEMFQGAGARLPDRPDAMLAIDLTDYFVEEGGTFAGHVNLHVVLQRGGEAVWRKDYSGVSHRWGRTHNPENYNEALSNALSDATSHLLQDDELGRALAGG